MGDFMELLLVAMSIVVGAVLIALIAERRGSMADLTCPNCSTEFVRRVRRRGIRERFVSIFYVYPFKCQLCGHRFKSLQWGVRYIRVVEDRREYDRMSMRFPAWMSGNNIDAKAIVTDISMGGCTLSSDIELAQGDILSLGLQVANGTLPVIVETAVVHNVIKNNAGVEFLRFYEHDRDQLEVIIHGLLLDRRQVLSTEDAPVWAHPASTLEQECMRRN